MLTMYRSKSAPLPEVSPEPPLPDSTKNKLNVALLAIFSVEQLSLLGPENRIRMVHIMHDFLDELQHRAFPDGPELSDRDIEIVLGDNRWVLMDNLERLILEAKHEQSLYPGETLKRKSK